MSFAELEPFLTENQAAIAAVLLGLAAGVLIGLLASRRRTHEKQIENSILTERLQARDLQLAEVRGGLEQAQAKIEHGLNEQTELRTKLAQFATRLTEERKSSEEKLAAFAEAREQVMQQFQALSKEALRNNNQMFLDLAKTNFEKLQEGAKGDLDLRQKSILDLVNPIRESLEKVDLKIGEIEKVRATDYGTLAEQIKQLAATENQLRTETSNLARALRAPIVRGRWGEIQLKRVVEMAGMVEYCDFEQQSSVNTESGRLRADMIIKLPSGKNIVVDSKVPLEAYLGAVEATAEEERLAKLKDHARQVRNHLQQLGQKAYWSQYKPAPEFVVLFLPGETFFSAALEQDPSLIEFGVSNQVIVATPTTLIALLKAVAYGWRQEQMTKNAEEVSELGRQLYERISTVSGYLNGLRGSLEKSVEFYNKLTGTIETRLLPSARRFKELGATAEPEIPVAQLIEKTTRELQAPELQVETAVLPEPAADSGEETSAAGLPR